MSAYGREHWHVTLKESPFHARLAPLNLRQNWIGWAGYLSANAYYDASIEYFALRNQATLYDLSPMIKYEIKGPDAERFLNRLVTRDVRKQKPGRVSYSVWCDDAGHVLDDGTIFRFGPEEFRLCCQERHLPWFLDSAQGFDVTLREVTDEIAGLALQGPCSAAILRRLGLAEVERLKPFDLARTTLDGFALELSRTGFTGDLGYELWVAPEQALALWDRLMAAGAVYGLRPMGSDALNMARIEGGFIMPKVDFVPAAHALRERGRSPFELAQERQVDFAKGPFNGRRALLAEQARGARYILVPVELEGHHIVQGSLAYYKEKKEIGFLTSAIWSPTVKRAIAYASLRRPYGDTIKDDLWVEVYVQKELKWDKVMARATVVPRPFFDPPRRKVTPPGDL
jgi:aminomethyltransferase